MQKDLEVVIIKFTFDINGRYEYPVLTLANIDKTELSIMEQVKSLVITPRFNAVSEMSFDLYKEYNYVTLPYYDKAVKNRLVHVDGWGWWVIYKVTETFDGGVPYKQVQCYSYEYTLNYKGVNLLNGTYKFYDFIDQEETLLYKLFSIVPNWKIGHVDTALYAKYRTFDIPETTLYGFLMDDVSKTYQCIFQYDIENMIVNVYEASSLVKETSIMITFDNVAKNIVLEELDTDIYTVLRVNGADNLSINVVNPLGDNRLFTFDYYKTDDWIGDKVLIGRINTWEDLIEQNRKPYADLLKNLRVKNRELITLKAELNTLKGELNALEIVRKNLMPEDPEDTYYDEQMEEFRKKTNEIDAKNVQIKAKEVAIEAKQKEASVLNDSLKVINDKLKFEKYFTHEEQLKLNPYIIESVYTDTNFIITDDMIIPSDIDSETNVLTTTGVKKFKDMLPTDILIDEEYIANQLLEQGREVAKRVSQPSFTFSLSTTNFLFVEKFLPFIKQIELGSLIYVEIEEQNWVKPILLEMTIDYDNPSNFNMIFGNRFRISDAEWTFSELHSEQVKTSSQVGSTLQIASEPVLNGTISEVKNYMNSNFNAAKQEIMSTSDNEITIGGYGLRGKKVDKNNVTGYDPHQLWINNQLICMTDDNWQNVKLAIGIINGKSSVNAEVVAGTLIAGEYLTITNSGGTFTVDGKGATMRNGSISVERKSGSQITSIVTLNPDYGIKIQKKTGSSLTDTFYTDLNGNLHFAGDLTGSSGTFTGNLYGATITGGSIDIGNGNFTVDSNGSLYANDGYFQGTVTASNFEGGVITGEISGRRTAPSFKGPVGINCEPGSGANGGLSVRSSVGGVNYAIWTSEGLYAERNVYAGYELIAGRYLTLGGKSIQSWDEISGGGGTEIPEYPGVTDYFVIKSPDTDKVYKLDFENGLLTSWVEK